MSFSKGINANWNTNNFVQDSNSFIDSVSYNYNRNTKLAL